MANENIIDQETIDAYKSHLRKLQSGPGGIMEMKQTIANLERYRDFVWAFCNEPMEMSYEKIALQLRYWKLNAAKLMDELERDR